MPKHFLPAAVVGGILVAYCSGRVAAEESGANDGLVSSWLAMVTRTQDEQPGWMTPLVTVTPRLEQEFRFDGYSEDLPDHGMLDSYGASNRVEFIPSENIELSIGIPPYETLRSNAGSGIADGWGDWPVLAAKYRLASANEQNGNYIVSASFQASAPVGDSTFTNRFWTLQPGIGLGKGWGAFDIQATVSEIFPEGGIGAREKAFGDPVLINVTAQYQLFDVVWPEVELNSTWWPDGVKRGVVQNFVTAGVIFGHFRIQNRAQLVLGAGYQVAVSPRDPAYRNNLILTTRLTF